MALTVIGLGGLIVTLVLTDRLTGTSAVAYRGGFLVSALAAAALILASVCVGGGPIARVLALRPLVWIGMVSYGAYLWHFPVAVELDAARTGLTGAALLVTRVAATFVLAAASYYLVERPIMEGTFWRSVRAVGPALAAMGATVAVVVVATVAPATAAAPSGPAGARSGLTPADHARLESAGAFSGHPVRLLMIGDSLAITMSVGLATGSVRHDGVQVIDDGVFGCDYDTSPAYSQGQLVIPYNSCLQWRTLYAGDIAQYHPDVVGLLTGRWTITDRVVDGATVHVGQPAWDDHVVAEYEDIVGFLATRGVKVVLFNLPYFDPPQEAPDGSAFPEDRPDRVTAFNRDLARVATAERGRVTLVDLNAILCPHGRFQTVVDRVVARWPDGVHITVPGGEWLQPRVLPTVARLGLEARRDAAVTATPPAHRTTHVRTSATGRRRVVALDGLRAFALLIIMGYHFGVGWLQGGFFSLDIFYVLSGYLITGLLLGEWARAARIRLGAFWLRRARRLLPALLVVLVVVSLVVRLAYPAGLFPDFRLSALSALFYFSNWWQIAASGNYFVATGAVSPLTHTWSLAVEEQFYLVWPLVVVAVLHLGRRFSRGIELLLGVSVAGGDGLGRRNGPALPPGGEHHPALLRHRHPRPVDPGGRRPGLRPDPGRAAPRS